MNSGKVIEEGKEHQIRRIRSPYKDSKTGERVWEATSRGIKTVFKEY